MWEKLKSKHPATPKTHNPNQASTHNIQPSTYNTHPQPNDTGYPKPWPWSKLWLSHFPNFGNREGAWLPEKGESVPDKLTLSNYNRMLTLSAEKPYRFSEDFIATLAKIVANCQPELAQEIIQSRLETAYAYGLERTRPSINRFMPAQIIENETVNLSALKDAAKILEKYEGNFHFPRRR